MINYTDINDILNKKEVTSYELCFALGSAAGYIIKDDSRKEVLYKKYSKKTKIKDIVASVDKRVITHTREIPDLAMMKVVDVMAFVHTRLNEMKINMSMTGTEIESYLRGLKSVS